MELRHSEARAVTPGLAVGFIAIFLVPVVGVVVALANVGTVYRAAGAVAHTNDVKSQLRALGRRLEEIFVIVNEETRQPVENPITRALREGVIVGLANHTVLIPGNGPEIPVDDSAAPIRTSDGSVKARFWFSAM